MKQPLFKDGDIFLVPLEDGSYSIGMFHKYVPAALNSCICSFYSNRYCKKVSLNEVAESSLRPISLLFVTTDLLKNKTWLKVGNIAPVFSNVELPDYAFKTIGSYKGVKVYGAGIVREFLNAFFGILPWDMMKDKNYFDKLLLDGVNRSQI